MTPQAPLPQPFFEAGRDSAKLPESISSPIYIANSITNHHPHPEVASNSPTAFPRLLFCFSDSDPCEPETRKEKTPREGKNPNGPISSSCSDPNLLWSSGAPTTMGAGLERSGKRAAWICALHQFDWIQLAAGGKQRAIDTSGDSPVDLK